MATGMVLVIVTRNIDLSVGSMLGLRRHDHGDPQVKTPARSIGFDHSASGSSRSRSAVLGALIGGFQGFIVAYLGVPSFIVTLGGLLVWRGAAWVHQRRDDHRADGPTFQLWAAARGDRSARWRSWILGVLACAGIGVIMQWRTRRNSGAGSASACAPMGRRSLSVSAASWSGAAVWSPTAITWPQASSSADAAEHLARGRPAIPTGIAIPVVILLAVALVMTVIATGDALRPLRLRHRRQPGGSRARRASTPAG